MEKYYTVNEFWQADDRRKLLAFARDLLNSDRAGHMVTFELFAQSPPFAHLNAHLYEFRHVERARLRQGLRRPFRTRHGSMEEEVRQ